MANASNDHRNRDPERDIDLDADQVFEGDTLQKRINSGELTENQADQLMQKSARRDAAEHDPDRLPDEGGTATEGGFGSGQGMGSESTKHGYKN